MPADSFIADFIAGWAGGGAGLLLGYPADTVKVRLQALNYSGAMECVKEIMRQESIGGFYKGMLFPFMSTGFLHSIYFGGHGITMKMLRDPTIAEDDDFVSPFGHLLAGSVVGSTLQWVPACPIEIVKTKLQVQKEATHHIWSNFANEHQERLKHLIPGYPRKVRVNGGGANGDKRGVFTSPWDCLLQTIRHEGVAGLYRGGLVMLIRDVVGFCCYLPVYELIKSYMLWVPAKSKEIFESKKNNPNSGNSTKAPVSHQTRLTVSLIAGGLAGVASWIPILPFDLIKSRLQADDIYQPKYRGVWHCAAESFRQEGIKVFFRSWQIVALRAFPVNAVVLLCYDETLRFFHSTNDQPPTPVLGR